MKKRLELAGLREDIVFAQAEHGVSERRACKLLCMDRASYRYEPRPDRDAELHEERKRPEWAVRGRLGTQVSISWQVDT